MEALSTGRVVSCGQLQQDTASYGQFLSVQDGAMATNVCVTVASAMFDYCNTLLVKFGQSSTALN